MKESLLTQNENVTQKFSFEKRGCPHTHKVSREIRSPKLKFACFRQPYTTP